jgi:hypothetical protein
MKASPDPDAFGPQPKTYQRRLEAFVLIPSISRYLSADNKISRISSGLPAIRPTSDPHTDKGGGRMLGSTTYFLS